MATDEIVALGLRVADNNSAYNNDVPAWVQYVKDHRSYLVANSKPVTITPELMHTYRYNPSGFMAFAGLPLGLTWLMLWINQIHGAVEFIRLTSLLLPNLDVVTALRAQYESVAFAQDASDSRLAG